MGVVVASVAFIVWTAWAVKAIRDRKREGAALITEVESSQRETNATLAALGASLDRFNARVEALSDGDGSPSDSGADEGPADNAAADVRPVTFHPNPLAGWSAQMKAAVDAETGFSAVLRAVSEVARGMPESTGWEQLHVNALLCSFEASTPWRDKAEAAIDQVAV